MLENKLRIIGYCILLAINGLLFYFLHSYFHFVVLIVMVSAPFLSVAMNFVLRKYISVEISNVADRNAQARQNEEYFIRLKIKNKTPFLSLDTRIRLKVGNTFFKTEGEQNIVVPTRALSGYELIMPLKPTLPGVVKISVEGVRIKDLMGMCSLKKKCDASYEFVVLPRVLPDMSYDILNAKQGVLESEESVKKGNDFSDVSEIREYIPGDKLMSIHWKLSAKRDILMVKDRSSMSDEQIVVVPELTDISISQLEAIIIYTYSIIKKIITDKASVKLIYYSASSQEYRQFRIDYHTDLDDAFSRMFYEKTYSYGNEAANNMMKIYPEIKSYMHVYSDGSEVWVKIQENG